VTESERQSSGGPHAADPPRAAVRVHAALVDRPLDPAESMAFVADATCGATAVFLGTVRDHHAGDAVTGLVYEAWLEEALPTMRRIADEVTAVFPSVRALYVEHRVGPLLVGEHAIVASASAPHRVPAQAAVAALVERVKAEVPIWKQEQLAAGGHRWPGVDTA
jgi:molybdopterin synthase catalytic subunit